MNFLLQTEIATNTQPVNNIVRICLCPTHGKKSALRTKLVQEDLEKWLNSNKASSSRLEALTQGATKSTNLCINTVSLFVNTTDDVIPFLALLHKQAEHRRRPGTAGPL